MYLITIAALLAVCGAAKLDRSYLPPPPSAKLAGGSPGSLQAPFVGKPNEALSGLPKGGYTNEFEGVVVDAVSQGTRGSSPDDTNLGLSRLSYGSTLSKVGDEAFKPDPVGFRQISGVSFKKELENSYEHNDNIGKFSVSPKPSPERPQAAQDRVANIIVSESKIGPTGYAYSFETDNGIAAEENAIESDGIRAQGGFRYKSDDGQVYTVTYTADADGYQPKGDHLPTPPPIPKEILKSLEQNAKEEAAGMTDDGSYDAQKYNTGGDYNERFLADGQYKDNKEVTPLNRPDMDSSGKFVNQNNQFIGSQKLITEQYRQGLLNIKSSSDAQSNNIYRYDTGYQKGDEFQNSNRFVPTENSKKVGINYYTKQQFELGLKEVPEIKNPKIEYTAVKAHDRPQVFGPAKEKSNEKLNDFAQNIQYSQNSNNGFLNQPFESNVGGSQLNKMSVDNRPSQLSTTMHNSGFLGQSSRPAYRPSNNPSNYLPPFSSEVIQMQDKFTKQSKFDNRKTQLPSQTLSDSQTTKFGYTANSQNMPHNELNTGIQNVQRQENNIFFQNPPSKSTQSISLTQSYHIQNQNGETSQLNKIPSKNFQNNPNLHHLTGTQQQISKDGDNSYYYSHPKPFNTPISSSQTDMNSVNLNQQHYFQPPTQHQGNALKPENTGITEAHIPSFISLSPNAATQTQQFQSQSLEQSSVNVLSATNQQSSNSIAFQYPSTKFQPSIPSDPHAYKPTASDRTTQTVAQAIQHQPESFQKPAPSLPTQQYAGELYQYTKPPESMLTQANTDSNSKYSGEVYEYKKPEDTLAISSNHKKQDNLQVSHQDTHSPPKSNFQAQNGKDNNGALNFQTKTQQNANTALKNNQPQFRHSFQTTHVNNFNQHISSSEKLPLENVNHQFSKLESSNDNKFSQFNTQSNSNGPSSSQQGLEQTHLSTKNPEFSNEGQTSQYQAQFNQRLNYQPNFATDVSQTNTGPKEVFSGPRNPPSFDATGYHY